MKKLGLVVVIGSVLGCSSPELDYMTLCQELEQTRVIQSTTRVSIMQEYGLTRSQAVGAEGHMSEIVNTLQKFSRYMHLYSDTCKQTLAEIATSYCPTITSFHYNDEGTWAGAYVGTSHLQLSTQCP